ncbi:MAG: carboxypeptidase regulatory-like domain-containing protein [Vicinamibacterales bacterium]
MGRFSRFARIGTGVSLALLLAAVTVLNARQAATAAVAIDTDDIGGVVTGAKGPEAGVWVIAQTSDLPTKYIRIVVTDDQGRYVLPDLPKAGYDVWVRGYGLVDSPKVKAQPGKMLNLKAVPAPTAKAAADYYPANYWYALLEPPPKSDFPGTGRNGNGIPEVNKTQGAWLGNIKMTNACTQCHQMGTKVTREISPDQKARFKTSVEAWDYRVLIGISGTFMNSTLAPLGRQRALQVFANWTDRIAKGEIPPVAPPRPSGVERNLVVTQWEWANSKRFVHDEISTDRRNPTLNAYGPVVGVEELSGDWVAVLDPMKHTDKEVPVPVHDASLTATWSDSVPNTSPYWGDEVIWAAKIAPHNPMFDSKGRVWITARGGCRVYDPKTDKVTRVEGCPVGHHLQFADDDVLWGDGGGGAWFDTKLWDKTGDDKAAGGRIVRVMDANGNGKLDQGWVSAKDKLDPAKDMELDPGQAYSVIPNPIDGSVWISYSNIPGGLMRYDPKTKLSEWFETPYMNKNAKIEGYLPHGIDIDRRTGVIWTGLNSGHYAEFDRRKCKGRLSGPTATGQHCPEGWTLHQAPGPNFKTVEGSGAADSYYLNWVDWYNTSGLGDNTPFLVGTSSDSLMALDKGKWVVLRVPYPLGFHPRGMDGRIDDAKAGWKGRGLWSTHAAQASWHQEGGKSERPKVIHFQIRPNPLAK